MQHMPPTMGRGQNQRGLLEELAEQPHVKQPGACQLMGMSVRLRVVPGPGKGGPSQGKGCMTGPASKAGAPSDDMGTTGGRHCKAAEGPTPDEAGKYPGNPIPAGRTVFSAPPV